jgi:hypothetical protein
MNELNDLEKSAEMFRLFEERFDHGKHFHGSRAGNGKTMATSVNAALRTQPNMET